MAGPYSPRTWGWTGHAPRLEEMEQAIVRSVADKGYDAEPPRVLLRVLLRVAGRLGARGAVHPRHFVKHARKHTLDHVRLRQLALRAHL